MALQQCCCLRCNIHQHKTHPERREHPHSATQWGIQACSFVLGGNAPRLSIGSDATARSRSFSLPKMRSEREPDGEGAKATLSYPQPPLTHIHTLWRYKQHEREQLEWQVRNTHTLRCTLIPAAFSPFLIPSLAPSSALLLRLFNLLLLISFTMLPTTSFPYCWYVRIIFLQSKTPQKWGNDDWGVHLQPFSPLCHFIQTREACLRCPFSFGYPSEQSLWTAYPFTAINNSLTSPPPISSPPAPPSRPPLVHPLAGPFAPSFAVWGSPYLLSSLWTSFRLAGSSL